MAGEYHFTHPQIANLTGLSTQRVGKLASKLSSVLEAYRVRGKSNVCLYNQDGFKIWEQIAQMEKRGIGPKSMEEKLRKVPGKADNSGRDSIDAPVLELHAQRRFYQGLDAGEELERRHHEKEETLYQTVIARENKRIQELKESHRRELDTKEQLIKTLQDQVSDQKERIQKLDVLLIEGAKKRTLWQRIKGR